MRTTTTTLEPLSSSDARAAILSCHDELRGLVTETIHCADGATTITAAEPDVEPLRARLRGLYQAFEEHLDFEQRILPTALRDVIGWGSVLQAQVAAAHEEERAALASAMSALDPGRGGHARVRVVERIRALGDALLRDLKAEERCLQHADIDALATDTPGG